MKFRVIEIYTKYQHDIWEFDASSEKKLRKQLKDPFFMSGGVKVSSFETSGGVRTKIEVIQPKQKEGEL